MQETYQCHLDAIIQFKLLCSMETSVYEIMICKSLHFVFVYIYICLFSSVFFKAAKIINEMDSNLKNNILILQNIGRYINNASPKKPPHIQNVLQGQKL